MSDQPSAEATADFNTFVQSIVDRKAREGEPVSWDNAVTMAQNWFKNMAENPELVEKQSSIIDIVDDHEARIQVLEQQVKRLLKL